MNIRGAARLRPKQIARIKKRLSPEEKRNMLQPYLPNGKRNLEFEKVYGREAIDKFHEEAKMGEGQDGLIREALNRQVHDSLNTKP